jgi:type IV pilus assembly protein PilC
MPSFNATVKIPSGETRTFRRDADSERSLLAGLRADGFAPLKVTEVETAPSWDIGAAFRRGGEEKPRRKDMQEFIRNLATLLRSGMDLERAVRTLEKESRGLLRRALGGMVERVREGDSLSAAMTRAKIFTPFQINIVRAGEYGGDLHAALARIASSMERESDLRSRVRNAVAYPIFLICFGLLSFLIMLIFILPKFMRIYEQMNVKLPFLTSVLLKVSTTLHTHGIWILPLAGTIAFLTFRYMLQFRQNLAADRFRLRIPFLGKTLCEMEVAAFLRTLGLLVQSGIPVAQSLGILTKVIGSASFGRAASNIEEGVQKGNRLSAEMRREGLFSETIVNLVSVGEESGRIEELLLETSEQMEGRIDQQVKGLITLLEPILILIVGTIIGLMVMAMLLPIFSLSAHIKRG